ncbi:MAG: hypothetical protein ASARMPREDX12_006434 [Alectoria sarmentosa]|nr:MAG: hypothetical protein ASARMPREDX12_006434 [Alectoria sarmentosa]
MTTQQGFAAYPPKVKHIEVSGYVEEANGIFHSRDIGRSFELFGIVYLVFGDTFCNNSKGDFVGLANNTVAIIEDKGQPLKSKYLEIEESGFIKPFLPLTPEEQQFEKNKMGRVVLWAFGGVVEMEDGTGCLWYQKSIDHGMGNAEYIGTGIAKILDGHDGLPNAQRMDNLIFGPDEPRMGTFTAIADGDFVYLYGDRPDGKIVLARVYNGRHDGRLEEKEAHYYWDGGNWVQDWREAGVVIEGMQQGAIVRSKLFGEDKPFMFVGTSKWADSQVFMGASAKLEGPWKLEAVCKVDGIKETTGMGKWMYCIYPQLWASNEEDAELMVTWSEQCPGGVVAGNLKLAGFAEDDLGS